MIIVTLYERNVLAVLRAAALRCDFRDWSEARTTGTTTQVWALDKPAMGIRVHLLSLASSPLASLLFHQCLETDSQLILVPPNHQNQQLEEAGPESSASLSSGRRCPSQHNIRPEGTFQIVPTEIEDRASSGSESVCTSRLFYRSSLCSDTYSYMEWY